jgi:uncharacterized damage-inducible protein DinB
MGLYDNTASTIGELFRHDNWARDLLLGAAAVMTDEQLDRKVDMGCGSLRGTLIHIHEAMYWWHHVCHGNEDPPEPLAREPMDELAARWRETAAARDASLANESPALDRPVTYRGRDGRDYAFPMRDVWLHVVNHGMHHRAQALNMLRRLCVEPSKLPRVDYVFMKLGQPDAPPLSAAVLLDFFRYNDWAQDRVMRRLDTLSDEQLDQDFGIGPGTLRRTMTHLGDAERWWFGNWTRGPVETFPVIEPQTPPPKIRQQWRDASAARDGYLATLSDDDLARAVEAQPIKDMFRSFPLGQTMLQLCNHGTHHRAQVLNMLRQLGIETPRMDYMVMKREEVVGI